MDTKWRYEFHEPTLLHKTVVLSLSKDLCLFQLCANLNKEIAPQHLTTQNYPYSRLRWLTYLHRDSLAGNLSLVKLWVKYGADVQARTPSGRTASELARAIGWPEVSDYLNGLG